MSGSALCQYWGFQSVHDALHQAHKLGKKLGINSRDKDELLAALYDAPAYELVEHNKESLVVSTYCRHLSR